MESQNARTLGGMAKPPIFVGGTCTLRTYMSQYQTRCVDVGSIYDTCMANTGGLLLSATDASTAHTSPFSLYCKYHVDPAKMDPPDPFLQDIITMGIKHEDEVFAADYPGIKTTPHKTPEEGFMAALKSMASGADAILNMPLFYTPKGMHGYPDVLERRAGRSIFGEHHYIVREIKAARHIKVYHTIQAAFYALMLGHIQGRPPEYFTITNMDHDTIRYDYTPYKDTLQECIMQAARIWNGWMPPAIYGTGAPPWSRYCNSMAIANNDISLIAGIGQNVRANLIKAGLYTIQDIASSSVASLQQIRGMDGKRAPAAIASARAIQSGQPVRKGYSIELPNSSTEIFLDMEGVNDVREGSITDYMIGVLIRTNGTETYRSFIAEDRREGLMLESFLEFMSHQDDYTIYHWGHYERTHLRSMMERQGIRGHHILEPDTMIDLYAVATESYAFPTYRNGIKHIAQWLNYKWQHDDVNATSAIKTYQRYVKDPVRYKHDMQKVIDYNRDDCMATRVVKDWLVSAQ